MSITDAQILQAVHIYSGSDALPFVNKRTRQALSGVSYLARWSLYNYTVNGVKSRASETVLDGLLKRRFCTIEVVERVLELWDLSFGLKRSFAASDVPSTPERPPVPPLMVRHIPRRLLRTTAATQPRIHPMIPWLVDKFGFSVDADSSFALKRAALDQNYELAEWLLARGANVRKNGMLSFKAAIMTKDLRMLKLLIEPGYQVDADGKQVLDEHGVPVKEADRVDAPQEWVDLALQHGARDIVLWLVEKKSEYELGDHQRRREGRRSKCWLRRRSFLNSCCANTRPYAISRQAHATRRIRRGDSLPNDKSAIVQTSAS